MFTQSSYKSKMSEFKKKIAPALKEEVFELLEREDGRELVAERMAGYLGLPREEWKRTALELKPKMLGP